MKQDVELENEGKEVTTIHDKFAVKEEGLKEYLIYDRYPREPSWIISYPRFRVGGFQQGDYEEIGDFC